MHTDTPVSVHAIKELIIRAVQLPGVKPEDFADDGPIFGEGLGLDSVDALELVVAVEKEFGIQIEDEQVGREMFVSPRALTDFINARLAGGAGNSP